jgi:predicted RNA binding protein YcfA (HicA-like mRNA interferase family)
MGKLPTLTGYEMFKFVAKLGFEHTSAKSTGSHFRLRHLDGRVVTIPVRKGKELKKEDFSSILRALEMGRNDFLAKYLEIM